MRHEIGFRQPRANVSRTPADGFFFPRPLTGLGLLAPHLTEHTVDELLSAAAHRTKAEIAQMLAQRFPGSEVLAWVAATSVPSGGPHAPAHAEHHESAMPPTTQHAPAHVSERSKLLPLAAGRFEVRFGVDQSDEALLRYGQELLGTTNIGEVFTQALRAFVPQLEKRKFAATGRPRRNPPRRSADPRHVPAHVKRAVWKRDGGRCTFVSEGGRRCEARMRLEFDHVVEVARGGEATVDGIRLRCRGHNQYAAERTFGPEFMRCKRIAAAEARAVAKAGRARAAAADQVDENNVVPWLQALGFSAAEARRGAERCRGIPDASIEERVRVALTCFRLRGTHVAEPACPAAG